VIRSRLISADTQMTAKAAEAAFVFVNRMAGYGADLTPECRTDDA
jgi:hypothetical protein